MAAANFWESLAADKVIGGRGDLGKSLALSGRLACQAARKFLAPPLPFQTLPVVGAEDSKPIDHCILLLVM